MVGAVALQQQAPANLVSLKGHHQGGEEGREEEKGEEEKGEEGEGEEKTTNSHMMGRRRVATIDVDVTYILNHHNSILKTYIYILNRMGLKLLRVLVSSKRRRGGGGSRERVVRVRGGRSRGGRREGSGVSSFHKKTRRTSQSTFE